uniref:Uncharacterized protein n=1 Tax=Sphaerodactylus townsendi TaxID=933632 RepID=A0ACB8EAG6_9SAUR
MGTATPLGQAPPGAGRMRTADSWLPPEPFAQPLTAIPQTASGGARRGLPSPREWARARPRHALPPPPPSARIVVGKVSAARRALKGAKRRCLLVPPQLLLIG